MKRTILLVLVALVAITAPAHAAKRKDRAAPKITYLTESGATLLSNPTGLKSDVLPFEVFGTVKDRSKITLVRGTFLPCTESSAESCSYAGVSPTAFHHGGEASMECTNGGTRCSWRIAGPTAPGYYWFAATAWDKYGNETTRAGILQITVV